MHEFELKCIHKLEKFFQKQKKKKTSLFFKSKQRIVVINSFMLQVYHILYACNNHEQKKQIFNENQHLHTREYRKPKYHHDV